MARKNLFIPFKELDNLQRRIQRSIGAAFSSYKLPHSHVIHSALKTTIEIRLPGAEKKNISVDISSSSVNVMTKKLEESKNGVESVIEYYRRILLPQGLDVKKAQVNFRKEALKIVIPRKIRNGH